LELIESCSREVWSTLPLGNSIPLEIKGRAYVLEVVKRHSVVVVDKNAPKGLVCPNCGEDGAYKFTEQRRSGDEGESTVLFCPDCKIKRVIAI
jgi:predicted RNA-binding Zn-ribbon protein involved in translation (DUF1610 family)